MLLLSPRSSHISPVVEMLSDLLVVSAPLSLPSLNLAYRLHKKDYLATVFNRQMAVVLVYSGQDIHRTGDSLAGV